MPTDDYWRRQRENLNEFWNRTAEIRKIEAKAREHAAKARELANQIEAKRKAELHRPAGQPRAKA